MSGPADRRSPLADLTVLDEQAQPVVMRSLWADRPAILAFVRHFG